MNLELTELREKKADSQTLVKALEKLTEEERLRIYYMVKGVELVSGEQKSA